MVINFNKEEQQAVIIQLGSRLDHFDNEMAECKDPARIREIVNYTKDIISFRDKLLNAR